MFCPLDILIRFGLLDLDKLESFRGTSRRLSSRSSDFFEDLFFFFCYLASFLAFCFAIRSSMLLPLEPTTSLVSSNE